VRVPAVLRRNVDNHTERLSQFKGKRGVYARRAAVGGIFVGAPHLHRKVAGYPLNGEVAVDNAQSLVRIKNLNQ